MCLKYIIHYSDCLHDDTSTHSPCENAPNCDGEVTRMMNMEQRFCSHCFNANTLPIDLLYKDTTYSLARMRDMITTQQKTFAELVKQNTEAQHQLDNTTKRLQEAKDDAARVQQELARESWEVEAVREGVARMRRDAEDKVASSQRWCDETQHESRMLLKDLEEEKAKQIKRAELLEQLIADFNQRRRVEKGIWWPLGDWVWKIWYR